MDIFQNIFSLLDCQHITQKVRNLMKTLLRLWQRIACFRENLLIKRDNCNQFLVEWMDGWCPHVDTLQRSRNTAVVQKEMEVIKLYNNCRFQNYPACEVERITRDGKIEPPKKRIKIINRSLIICILLHEWKNWMTNERRTNPSALVNKLLRMNGFGN